MDGRKDGRTDGQGDSYIPPNFVCGGIKSFRILIFVVVDVQINAIVFFYFQVGWGGGGVV